jgi:hypothetical protein
MLPPPLPLSRSIQPLQTTASSATAKLRTAHIHLAAITVYGPLPSSPLPLLPNWKNNMRRGKKEERKKRKDPGYRHTILVA